MDLLIKNLRIADDKPPTDIAIEGGKVVSIEQNIGAAAKQRIDAEGRVGVPGFLEPHLHLEKAFFFRRMPAQSGTLEEAIHITGILKNKQERGDVLTRSRQVLDMAVKNGTVAVRAHPDVDMIQGLIGVETALELKKEYQGLLDLQIVAFPQEGIIKSPGTFELMERAMAMGADVVGGCPYNEATWEDTKQHINMAFSLAKRHGAPVDMHADFADDATDLRFASATYVAKKTIELGYQGRVTLGHVTSLAALEPPQAKPVFDLLHQAAINIVTLPATDLYLGGRKDTKNQRRGVTPVRALRDAGVNVAYSSNNIRNAFTPFGKADPLLIGNLLAHVAQCGTAEDQAYVLSMGTYGAAKVMGIDKSYGIGVGKQADLVILDTQVIADALLDIPARSWVIKGGRITVVTHHTSEIQRH